jgi:hypothetical protein
MPDGTKRDGGPPKRPEPEYLHEPGCLVLLAIGVLLWLL